MEASDVDLVFVDDNPLALELNGQRILTYVQWLSLSASSRHMNVGIAITIYK